MPGGRLTHDDRQRIAAWLAEGLGYAEIARRLGRPTSTISREVARNGEPGRYLADHAQHIATRRTHRGKWPSATSPATDGGAPDPTHGFAEQFAALLAATGLPRMSARVFTCLLMRDSGSLTAGELVRQLKVSPASVSKAIGYLEAMDLVVREPDPHSRRERYAIADDVWLRAWRTDTGAHAQVAAAARRGAEMLGTDTAAGTRLHKMAQFFTWLSDQMSDSGQTDNSAPDALTVVAALTHAAMPLTLPTLATALDWPHERVSNALQAIEHRPAIADPLAVISTQPGTYTITAKPGLLTTTQRGALDALRGRIGIT